MRILTVKQPWAGLIAAGVKDVENRTWRVEYRGPIAIHAALNPDVSREARRVAGQWSLDFHDFGVVLAVADLVDVVTDSRSGWAEAGVYHWQLANVRPLQQPFPYRGRQGLTELAPRIADALLAAAGPAWERRA